VPTERLVSKISCPFIIHNFISVNNPNFTKIFKGFHLEIKHYKIGKKVLYFTHNLQIILILIVVSDFRIAKNLVVCRSIKLLIPSSIFIANYKKVQLAKDLFKSGKNVTETALLLSFNWNAVVLYQRLM